ncbi:MAG: nuclear transport factor 2 family protein [Pseudomonadota bacterium]
MLSFLLMLAVQTASGKLPPGNALPPQSVGQEQAVLATVQSVLASFEAGDSAALLRQVYPDGRVTATGTRSSGSGLRRFSWTEFAKRVTPADRFTETISDPAVEVDGDAAMVWAPFVVRVGGKVSNCGFDHFDLVRENGVWKVMNLTFSSRVTGCGE